MSNVGRAGRSFKAITKADLLRLRDLAAEYRADFFRRRPDWASLYRRRFLCSALCQGAALHYVEGIVGIQDFDVYNFWATHPSRAWYAKARPIRDFGDPKFGRSPDRKDFVGRRVDLLGRSIDTRPGDDPERALRAYLAGGRTLTARLLAQKAVVGLEPARLFGRVLWRPRRTDG